MLVYLIPIGLIRARYFSKHNIVVCTCNGKGVVPKPVGTLTKPPSCIDTAFN